MKYILKMIAHPKRLTKLYCLNIKLQAFCNCVFSLTIKGIKTMYAIISHFILICLLIHVFIIFYVKAIHMPFLQLIDI